LEVASPGPHPPTTVPVDTYVPFEQQQENSGPVLSAFDEGPERLSPSADLKSAVEAGPLPITASEPIADAEAQLPAAGAPPGAPVAVPATPAPPRPSTFTIMLLGDDRDEPGKGTWRTDVMALVVIQPETKTSAVLAIPRDLYVNIPDHEPDRINTVDFLGHYTKYPGDGPALLNRTLQENFGFGFDRYVRIDFTGFVNVVDTLGGIDVDVDCPLEEVFADKAFPGGRLLKISAGLQHMDGATALMFVRQRHDNGDTDRSRRQFKVLMALREKALKMDTIPLIPKLWTSYRASVQTDLSLTEAIKFAGWLYDFDADNIRGRIIDQTMATPWTTPKGAWVLLPDRQKIADAYQTLLTGPRLLDAGHRTSRCPQ
jgi:LCP family protein required for cell wall assembly